MPSLHVGMPVAIWLAFIRWDDDGRWNRFTKLLGVFILVTSFTIVYLGIHWIADILGGVIIAHLAVALADKTRKGVWGAFDERLIGRRFALLIDNPKLAVKKARRIISRALRPYRQASKKQTSAAIVAVLLTTTILVYDATPNHSPWRASNSHQRQREGEWMIAVNETPDEAPTITAWNLSTTESFVVGGAPWAITPSVEISEDNMAIYAVSDSTGS